jgi:hypothetical protein
MAVTNVALVPGVLGFERFGPLHYFNGVAGHLENDVSGLTSAQRGRQPFAVWPADHADMIGHDLNGPTPLSAPRFDYLQAYEHIIRNGVLP